MIKNKLIYFFLAGTFLTACSDNEAPAIDPKAYPLVIKAKVYNSYDTEQEGVTWTKPEDIIGVYVLKSGSSEVVSPHANLSYSPTPTSYDDYFQPNQVDAIPYFPTTGKDVWDVTIYYPRQETFEIEGMVPLKLDKQGELKASTLLYGRAKSLTKENTVASMRLAPALSRLVFYFHAGEGISPEQLSDVTVDLDGLPTIGNFNVIDGSFSADAESIISFRMRTSSSTNADVARTTEAFVMPLGSTQGYVATITAKQLPEALTKKIYSISSSIGSLERGMQYVFDVTVNTNGYIIESSSSPIAGWEEGDKISGEGEETQP